LAAWAGLGFSLSPGLQSLIIILTKNHYFMNTVTPQLHREVLKTNARQAPADGNMDESRLLTLAESIGNMGHWYWVLATGAVNCSEQIAHITGRGQGTQPGDINRCLEFLHPEDRGTAAAHFDHSIATHQQVEFQARIVRPCGEIRHVILKCQPEFTADGQPVALFGIMSDVTDAVTAIRSIHEQRDMLDLAAQLANLGHWVWTASSNSLTFCSEQLARIHEMTPDVFLARFPRPQSIGAVVDAACRDAYVGTIKQAFANNQPYAIDYKIETRFANVRYIRENGQPMFDSAGALVRFVGTVQDVTEAKRREEDLARANAALEAQTLALSRSESKFRDIVESSIQGIVIVRGSTVLFANDAFAKMSGAASAEELLALDDVRMLLPKGRESNADMFWSEALTRRLDGVVSRREMRGLDGRMIWIDALGRLIEWEGAPAFMLTAVDVTSRHLADQALLQKSRELEALNQQKDKLFSIIAHDLKGPFNSVLGFAGLLAAKAPTMPPEKIVEYADIVYSAATNVHDLLDNLLAWASVQMRSTELRSAVIDLKALMAASYYPLTAMAMAKGVTVINTVGDIASEGDESMIRIVLRNLISNGIKFTPRGGKVSVGAQPLLLPDGRPGVVVSVRDTGVGMDAETLADLFSFSRKVSRPGTQGERGTGLGLFLCRDIVERHGGKLSVESQPGHGTVFRFTLPMSESPS
jgi:PAS domain S-box-containing protein